MEAQEMKFIRCNAVLQMTGLSRSTVWRMERQGQFPRRHRIAKTAVGWLEEDICAWMTARIQRTEQAHSLQTHQGLTRDQSVKRQQGEKLHFTSGDRASKTEKRST